MTLVVNDRVQEVSTSTGSGPFVLGGGVTGYQTFSVGIGNTNSTYYTITNGTNWMDILGTYTSAANSITVDKILTSSAGGTTAVSFAAGTKNIFCTYPAATAVLAAPATYPTIQPSLNLDFANTKQLDPRITFVRNSTAAYYDGQTSALAEQNLLIGSQTIGGTGWILGSNIVTLNSTTAPDNTTTASSITENATVNNHFIGSAGITVTTGLPYTFSVYLKKGVGATAPQYMQFYAFSAAFNCGINVDLNAGTINSTVSVGATVSASSSVSMGNGWYRFIFTATALSSSTSGNIPAVVFINNNPASGAAPSYLGLVTSDVQAWGAQLEQRSSVTAYTPTTTAAITNYIPQLMTAPAGVARFDCNPLTRNSLGLLIEESRVNLLTYSSDFSNAVWVKSNSTVTSAANVAPDGTQTAFNLVSNTSTGLQAIAQTVTKAASALAYTSTVHFKANQYTYSWLQISDGAGNGAIVYFNLTTGAISTAVAGIGTAFTALSATTPTSIGNGWYRCNITGTSNTATSLVTQFGSSTNGTSNSVVGNGYSGIFIWGAQLEAGSFATSYIPTVASTVTRATDQASMTGTNFSSWWNVSQSTFVVEFDKPNLTNVGTLIGVYGGISLAQIEVTSNAIGSNVLAFFQPSGTLNNAIGSSSLSSNKFSVSFGANLFAPFDGIGAINGASGIFGTGAYFPNPLFNSLYIGLRQHVGDQKLNGHIRKLSYYPVALSSANLVALTS